MAKQDPKPVADKTEKKSSIPTKPITKRQMNAIAVEKTMAAAAKEKAGKAPAAKPKPVAKAAEQATRPANDTDAVSQSLLQKHAAAVNNVVLMTKHREKIAEYLKTFDYLEHSEEFMKGIESKLNQILDDTSLTPDGKVGQVELLRVNATMTSPKINAISAIEEAKKAAKDPEKPAGKVASTDGYKTYEEAEQLITQGMKLLDALEDEVCSHETYVNLACALAKYPDATMTSTLKALDKNQVPDSMKYHVSSTMRMLLDPSCMLSSDDKAEALKKAFFNAMASAPAQSTDVKPSKPAVKPVAPKKPLGADVPAIGGSRAMSKIRRVMEEAEKTTLGEGAKLKSIPPWEDLPDTPAAIEAPPPVKKAVVAPKEASLSEVLAQAKTTPAGVSHGTSSASFADIINNAAVAASPLANLGFTIPGAAPSKK